VTCDCTCHRLLRRSTRIHSEKESAFHEATELFDVQWELANYLAKAPVDVRDGPQYLGMVDAHGQLRKLFVHRASEAFGLAVATVEAVMTGQTDPRRGAPSVDA
jgi:hypothetical protein